MKKIFVFASMMLMAAVNYSCYEEDNPVPVEPAKTTIELEGQQYEAITIATLVGEPGAEVSLNIGVYDEYDIYGVDFGDGEIITDSVFSTNTRITGASGNGFKGVIGESGKVTIYGNSDVWYLNASGGAMPTSLLASKLKNVQELSLSGIDAEELDLAGLDELTKISISNTPVRKVNLTANPKLTSVNIINTTISAYEPQLESIDLSANPELTSVTLGSSFYKQGQLTSIDLSANTKLETIVVSNNKLTSVTLPAGADISQLSLDNNQLESVDLSQIGSLKNIQIQNNKLKSIDLSKMVEASRNNVYVNDNELEELTIPVPAYNLEAQNNKLKKVSIVNASYSCKLENNQLTLATLPAKPAGLSSAAKTRRFTYAPQAAIEVAATVTELDLSDQLTATGVNTEPATTTFSFATASGTTLAEGTDYEVTAPGKFKFIKAQTEKVHAILANEALPLLTGDNALVTTEFTVEAAAAATTIFSWEAGQATGGTVVGNGADAEKVTDKQITVSSKKANIATDNITITLEEALKAGDKIQITGYRKKDTDANGNLYILFENGTVIDEGSEVTWNNTHENVGQQPNTNTYDVTDAAGSKTIQLARSKSGTNVNITKIVIVRN